MAASRGADDEAGRGGTAGLDADLDVLYAAPLDEFVATRDRLARDRRTAGDREAATELRAVRKPSRGAWALNQAVRAAPAALDAVVEAGDALRATQQRSLEQGDASGVRDATRRHTAAIRACADIAVSALGATGEAVRPAIEATLRTASLDPEAAAEVRAGRLAETLGPIDVFATLEPGPSVPSPRPRTAPAPSRAHTAPPAPSAPVPEASPFVRLGPDPAIVERLDTARAEATAARAELDDAEAAHVQARAAADAAGQRVREARRRVTDAERALRHAEAAAARATGDR